jgi:hypothetical protein
MTSTKLIIAALIAPALVLIGLIVAVAALGRHGAATTHQVRVQRTGPW